jgi:hypothetical protein
MEFLCFLKLLLKLNYPLMVLFKDSTLSQSTHTKLFLFFLRFQSLCQ